MKALSIEQIQTVIAERIPKGIIAPAHDEFGHHYMYVPTGQVFDSVTTQMQGVLDNPHLKVWAARLAVDYIVDSVQRDRTILDRDTDELKTAAVMVHKDTFEDAGGIGTVGHGAVENYLLKWMQTGIRPENFEKFISGQDSREWAILRSALAFMDDFYFLPVASELLVCNIKDNYAGTLDCLGFIIIPEYKCTSESGKHSFLWSASSRDWRKKQCIHCRYIGTYKFAMIDWKTSNAIQHKPAYYAQVSAYNKALQIMTGLKTDILVIVRLDKKQAKYEILQVLNEKTCYQAFKDMKKISAWLKIKHTDTIIKKEIIKIL